MRPHRTLKIQEAIADDSNLAENSEYQAAKTEQEINEARIAELEDKLARADIIDVSKLSGDIIKFGATVTLIDKDTGNEKVWQIVGEPEADANKGRISVISPIARALIGKAKGATVEVEAPGGANRERDVSGAGQDGNADGGHHHRGFYPRTNGTRIRASAQSQARRRQGLVR